MSTSDTEVSKNSLEIVRSFITTWNDHDISATMELLDPDIAFQSPLFSDPVRGIKARTEVNENFMTSMPDFQYRLIRIASDGDYVAAELVGTGTSTGPTKLPGELRRATAQHEATPGPCGPQRHSSPAPRTL